MVHCVQLELIFQLFISSNLGTESYSLFGVFLLLKMKRLKRKTGSGGTKNEVMSIPVVKAGKKG